MRFEPDRGEMTPEQQNWGSQKMLRAARKVKEREPNGGTEVSEIRRPDHAYLHQSFWREVFPLDFEMEEKKSKAWKGENMISLPVQMLIYHCHM